MRKDCDTCKKECKSDVCLDGEWFDLSEKTGVIFPILNNLNPTVESCTMKVLEEVGELMQLIGKGQGKSGERVDLEKPEWALKTASESIDTAQAAITQMVALCREYGLDADTLMELHEQKLREKGYLR